jgi:NAD(P)-dependent dehydrogenase (short-subunit alcohol dehydrogenase family)
MVDISEAAAHETLALVLAAAPMCVTNVVAADVSDVPSLEAAFKSHVAKFGSLHACFNNAGVAVGAWQTSLATSYDAI